MKTAEAKPAATVAKTNSPFFSKKNEREGLGSSLSTNSFFKKSSSTYPIQTKLTIGQPDDRYEKQADRMADKTLQRINKSETKQTRNSIVQRKCAECEKEDKKKLQKKSEGHTSTTGTSAMSKTLNSSAGQGQALPGKIGKQMENSFHADFSNVRIHNDSSAIQMNKSLNAQAFTHGSDIYFNEGKYDTSSNSGKHLLAHELTHVVQQNASQSPIVQRTPGSPAGGCGVCYGSPMLAGRVAHAFIQEEFQLLYPDMLTEHHILSVLPAASNFSGGFLDLAILEAVDQIAIGEIKPANAEGVAAGEAKLNLYETALEALGMRVRRLDYPVPPVSILFPTLGRGPLCEPLQALIVDPPVDGLYTYWCEPDFSVLRPECNCIGLEELEEETAEEEAAAEESTAAESSEAAEVSEATEATEATEALEATEAMEATATGLETAEVATGVVEAGAVAAEGFEAADLLWLLVFAL